MKKFLGKNWGDVRGTALLVSLLVMGVLIAISLILSSLILRETRVVKDLIDAGKAYYAAESGVEMALYELNNKLPGWEPEVLENGYKSFEISENYSSVGEFKVANRCNAYPCFDEDFDVSGEFGPVPAHKEFYGVLDLNESITIPLFVAEDDGTGVANVGNFVVEFFAPFDPGRHLNITADNLSGWDVLRWKVFGIRKGESGVGAGVTESISDFTALSLANRAQEDGVESFSTNATNPSWFGSLRNGCSDGVTDEQKDSRYNSDIICNLYEGAQQNIQAVSIEGQVSKVIAGNCWPWEAREYYLYQYEGDERKLESDDIHSCYGIKEFLNAHELNYLSLTNLINPAVFNVGANKEALSKLYFRVELFNDGDTLNDEGVASGNQTVREFAEITANGYSGDAKQSIDVRLKRNSFMPVFHFSLYSTYMNESAGHDQEYWYGPEEGNIELLPG